MLRYCEIFHTRDNDIIITVTTPFDLPVIDSRVNSGSRRRCCRCSIRGEKTINVHRARFSRRRLFQAVAAQECAHVQRRTSVDKNTCSIMRLGTRVDIFASLYEHWKRTGHRKARRVRLCWIKKKGVLHDVLRVIPHNYMRIHKRWCLGKRRKFELNKHECSWAEKKKKSTLIVQDTFDEEISLLVIQQ